MEPHKIQGSTEWLEYRKTRIGSSDAPIIMGLSPWKTPFQLWEEKLGLREPPPMNSAMNRGKELESIALDIYNNGEEYIFHPNVLEDIDYPWMIGSFDGYCEVYTEDDDIQKYGVEIKCGNINDHLETKNDLIPEKYYPQLQHLIYVGNLEYIDYFSFRSVDDYTITPVGRDDNYINKLIEKEKEFYECLINKTPPPLCMRDFTERKDIEWIELTNKFKKAKEHLDFYKKLTEEYRKDIIELINDRPSIGNGVKMSKTFSQGRVQYEEIPELEGVDLDKYREESSESWRLTII